MLPQEQRDRLLDVGHGHKAADQVRHVQQGVVFLLAGTGQLVELLVLLLAVGHGVVGLLLGLCLAGELLPGGAALVDGAQRLLDVIRGHLVERAAVVHGAAVSLAVELEQRAAEGRFAAAGLADQAKRLALVDVQRDAVVRADEQALLLQREILLEVADAQQHLLALVRVVT